MPKRFQPWLLEVALPRDASRIQKAIIVYRNEKDDDVTWVEVPVVRAMPDNSFPKPKRK